ncbi:F0F1 ATP synthase subunit A [Caulobacter vibrioides]|uniref:ATP synthase subunit a n=2 Tax=Caulobacter vibrioides TaxID=155892 RepID=Q9AB63_CAUVC|nr:F0F1 ATP synthase subunit A [Caulobacter vibrioides]YP_002515748.1 ATP synthase A chain [Caulobacter vibrioides NA1000]QBQ56894.1 F0F1 ATP synthase subunit A [synthetic Caulobacter sp. 'ethensis']AAK22355.1 ATP synthase F0, A subunit [Caulobacter vibrioides CB15]ACL93840.1 ATP synthase A chain [Caulobacter vibrioides NA1000]ATC23370.1 F0F1 ATP synthase subunit A [Caulobacter vibrioides]ATC27198.1 F0F1 ATP synthase subunit A [Caulobacter vibrioides]
MADPMHQFQIQKIVELPTVTVPGLGAIDLSITNSVAAMMSAALLIIGFYALSAKKAVVPGRLQSVGEMLYGLVDGLAESIIGHDGKKFLPFIFTLFAFVLFMNVQGMFLVFTATSQLAVTLTLGLMVILTVVAVGFAKNGLKFFKLFAPSGVPWPLYFLLVPIEILSFLIRPITLGLRLFGNMLGGHVVLKIFAGFVVALGGLGVLGWAGAALALTSVVALTALEFMVAFLQAFVFAVLACVYINDVVHLDSH